MPSYTMQLLPTNFGGIFMRISQKDCVGIFSPLLAGRDPSSVMTYVLNTTVGCQMVFA